MLIQTTQLKAELLAWLEANETLKGAIVLRYLIKFANLPVHSTFLEHNLACNRPLDKWPDYPEAAAYGLINLLEDMDMADSDTIAECQKECKRLLAKIAACGDLNDYHGMEKHQHEYEQILSYLKEVRKPNGRLKPFPPSWNGSYHMVYSNISRVFAKLQEETPTLASYAKKCLETGQWYKWSELPPSPAQTTPWLMCYLT